LIEHVQQPADFVDLDMRGAVHAELELAPEEREVRVIYIPDYDPRGFLKPCLDYHIGPRGLESKLKYVFGRSDPSTDGRHLPDEIQPDALITDLLEFILLGPTVSSRLAQQSFVRMLERNNLQVFSIASSLPQFHLARRSCPRRGVMIEPLLS
jgi:hypothetical protein